MQQAAAIPAAPSSNGTAKTSRYIVQRAVGINHDLGGEREPESPEHAAANGLWEDVTSVEVPVRTHRRSVIAAALEKLGVADEDLPQAYRALDADTAEIIPVRLEQAPVPPPPPAVRRIG